MNRHPSALRQGGITLVEIMVSIVLGSILLGALLLVVQSNKQSSVTQTGTEGIQENARYATEILLRDVRQAGFYGGHQGFIDQIDGRTAPTSAGCNATTWLFMVEQRIYGLNDSNNDGTTTGNYSGAPCIPAHIKGDVLVVRHASPYTLQAADLVAGGAYFVTNFTHASIFTGTAVPAGLMYQTAPVAIHQLVAHAYFLGASTATCATGGTASNLRSLYRLSAADSANINREELVTGLEDFQVQYGVDTKPSDDTDYLQADQFLNAGAAALVWSRVVAVRVWLLMKSVCGEPGYTDTATYNMAGTALGPFNDNVRRQLFTMTINIRNPLPRTTPP